VTAQAFHGVPSPVAYRRRCSCRYRDRFLALSFSIFKAREIPDLQDAAALCASGATGKTPPNRSHRVARVASVFRAPVGCRIRLARDLFRRGLGTSPARPCAGAIDRSEGGSAGAPAAVRDLVAGPVISPGGSHPPAAAGTLGRRERWRAACRNPMARSIRSATSAASGTCRGPCGRPRGCGRSWRRNR